ncbi:MAG TPA: dihydropteroate synthase [Bacteroidia bacterium]|nr:dihydropteroate synthase [Bacteroidia bacterium]
MGILNVTPDSFYDGGKFIEESGILKRVEEMIQQGAAIIDIGGASSRQNSAIISVEDELLRTIKHIELIIKHFPGIIISIDTWRARVAKEAIEAGASIVNDISGGDMDEEMFKTVATLQSPYILMHMQGTPQTMQVNPVYENVVTEVIGSLKVKMEKLRSLGVHDIIVDPGFGFGKTNGHNFRLLKNLNLFKILKAPVMVGVSRKSMINKTLNIKPNEALNGTTALNMAALMNGANILRVHDVKEAMETIQLYNNLQAS